MRTANDVRQLWRQDVSDKLVPGSTLEHQAETAHGHRFELITPRVPYAEVIKRHDRIAAALDVSREELRIAPGSSEGRALVTVITDNPLAGTLPYRGPEFVAIPDEGVVGAVPMGPTLDAGEAYTVVEDESGVYGGVCSGDPGSGKSTAFAQIGAGLLASGRWFPVYCDGDPQANSSAFLNEHMPIAGAGPRDAWEQLEAIEDAVRTRGHLKNALIEHAATGAQQVWFGAEIPDGWRPADRIKPSPEFPGIAWLLDEFSLLTADAEFAQRVLAVVRIARKLAMAVFVSTQSLLKPDFGSTELRGFLVSRNLFAFHAESPQEMRALGDRGIDPGRLPTGGGFAYYSRSQAAAVRMRTRFTRDMAGCVRGLSAPSLDARTGEHFVGLERVPDQVRLSSISWLQGRDNGQAGEVAPVGSRVVNAAVPRSVWATQPVVAVAEVGLPEDRVRPLRLVEGLLMTVALVVVTALLHGLVLLSPRVRGELGRNWRVFHREAQIVGQHVWCAWLRYRAGRERRARQLV